MGLKIEISSNLKIVIFLDVTLNLNDNSYKPFSKANAIPTYLNFSSNRRPAPIVKQIPNLINMRINRLSSKNIFNNHKEFYNEASVYKNELKHLGSNRHHNTRENRDWNNNENLKYSCNCKMKNE